MVTGTTGAPTRREADVSGSLTVALARTNTGEAPYLAHTRRSRRSTSATCEPKTPRYPWHSSTTTYLSPRRKEAQSACRGRIPRCSMSGLVSTKRPCRRTQSRSSRGVSPS